MRNFKAIYRILTILERAMDMSYAEFDIESLSAQSLGISENRLKRIYEMMSCEGLITGESIKQGSKRAFFPVITLKGLEYLEDSPMMKKAAEEIEREKLEKYIKSEAAKW